MKNLRHYGVYILAVLLLGAGGAGWLQAHELRSTASASNRAVVDSSETAQVQSAVSQALTRVLTYDFAKPKSTEAAADQTLSGEARKEYDTLFADLEKRAPDQKLVLSARVQSAAVKSLTDDEATLVVFLDQTSQRASDKQASISAAQLAITATRKGPGWTITELKPL